MHTGLRSLAPVIFITLLGGCIPAQNINTVNAQLSALTRQNYLLKNELDAVKENNDQDQQALRSQYASLKAEFKNIREEMLGLRGELQSTSHLLDQHLNKTHKKAEAEQQRSYEMNQALLARIIRIEDYLGFEFPSEHGEEVEDEGQSVTAPEPTTQALSTSDERLYTLALQAFEAGDYQAARDNLKKLLKSYPDSNICDNARFWIGESYYREKWYEKAILEYQKVIDTYPTGNKIPDALLKQGMAFHNINDNNSARQVFKKLIEQFPDAGAAKIAKQKMNEL